MRKLPSLQTKKPKAALGALSAQNADARMNGTAHEQKLKYKMRKHNINTACPFLQQLLCCGAVEGGA
jgi:hypothetical protein